jgi:DNA ligase-1
MTTLAALVATSRRVAGTSSRNAKVAELAAFLRSVAPDEIPACVAYLAGEAPRGRSGVGYALLADARPDDDGPPVASLQIADVDAALTQIAATAGPGSKRERTRLLHDLLSRATVDERDFLQRLLVGELRQGALESLMVDAVALAASLPAAAVRQAAMVGNGIARVAQAALTHGHAGIGEYALAMMQPIAPMLAQPANDMAEAMDALGTAAIEWKIDGARVQVHKAGGDVRVFTRNRNDVTESVPEIVEAIRTSGAADLIVDGEAIALHGTGAPLPFQQTMRRFGRTLGVDDTRALLPLSVLFFDCLRHNGVDMTDKPAVERFDALARALAPAHLMPRIVTGDLATAEAFHDDALRRGHEGVMVKSLDARYEPGRRSAAWLKVKRLHTLDLVILAAEWGHGRRRGWLSNLHLGARDRLDGRFVMLGKTFKGLTDDMLAWQTKALLERETHRDGVAVHVRPEIVVEVAFNDLQSSPRYPGGLALRFARVKRYRPDKSALDADTIDTVQAIYDDQLQRGRGPA